MEGPSAPKGAPMTDTVLDTRDLSMRFGGVQAVNNVNFSLQEADR